MINRQMKTYDYYKYESTKDAYGQETLSETAQGKIKMIIYTSTQRIEDNIIYKDAEYIGLTRQAVDDKCVISYGCDKLKVLYVNSMGRLNQVYMARM